MYISFHYHQEFFFCIKDTGYYSLHSHNRLYFDSVWFVKWSANDADVVFMIKFDRLAAIKKKQCYGEEIQDGH
jgi:hypothetical protein